MSEKPEKLILKELRRISKILTLSYADTIEKELGKVATTDDRKMIWLLIDSNSMSKDIAKEVGITERSVNRFLKIAENAGLIENPKKKPPKRIIDYVPPSWIDLLAKPEEEDEMNE